MTNIDQIVPKDMPEWFFQENGEWYFCLFEPDAGELFSYPLEKLTQARNPYDKRIRYLAGCMMMLSCHERMLATVMMGKEWNEAYDNYDAARDWRDQKDV